MRGPEGDPEPDPDEVLAYLRRRAAARPPNWPDVRLPRSGERPPLAGEPALAYLHAHWVLPDATPPRRGRGVRGVLRAVAGRLVFAALHDYLVEERAFLSQAVQLVDTIAQRVDTLDKEVREMAEAANAQLAELHAYVPFAEHETRDSETAGTGAPSAPGEGEPSA